MADYDYVCSILEPFMPKLITALKNSPSSEEEWIKVIIAAYYVACNQEVGNEEDEAELEWMQEAYWKGRELKEKDKKDESLGYDPSNCDFWDKKQNGENMYGLKVDRFYLEKCAKMLNTGNGSYKVFNRMHYYENDPALTIGFQHLAAGNEQTFFEKMYKEYPLVYKEMLNYITYRLLRSDKEDPQAPFYRLQVANDKYMKSVLFPSAGEKEEITVDQLNKLKTNDWINAISTFFSEKGVFEKKTGRTRIREYNSPAQSKTASNLQSWAEDVMEKYYGNDKKFGIKDGLPTVTYKDEKGNKRQAILLFQISQNPDGFKTGFWFHDIVKDALLLKSVAAYQIKYWEEKFFTKGLSTLKNLLATVDKEFDEKWFTEKKEEHDEVIVSGILSLVSWVNSAPAVTFSLVDEEEYIEKDGKKKSVKRPDKELWLRGIVSGHSFDSIAKIKQDQFEVGGSIKQEKLEAVILLTGFLYEYHGYEESKKRAKNNFYKDGKNIGEQFTFKAESSLRPRTKEIAEEYWDKWWIYDKKTPLSKIPFTQIRLEKVKRITSNED